MSWSGHSGRDGFWRSGYSDRKKLVLHVQTRSVCGCAPHVVITTLRRRPAVSADWGAVGLRSSKECNKPTLPLLCPQPKEEIKALEAALAALPDKVPKRPQRGARKQTLGPTLRRMSRRPSTRFQGKTSCDCSVTSSTSGIRESRCGRVSYSCRTCRARETQSQTTQPTCLQTTSCKASPLSPAVTELSRHMPATEASTVQKALDGLLSLIAQAAEKASRAEAKGSATCVWDCEGEDLDLDTRRRPSRHPQARLRRRCAGNAPYGQTSHQSKTMSGCADGGPMAATESTAGWRRWLSCRQT